MPYKKPTTKFITVRELCLSKGIRSPELARILGCSQSTAYRKLKEPKLMTLEDLDALHTKGHIEWDVIRGNIK